MAGGFTEHAAPNRTKVIRTLVDGRQETIVVDLNEVVERGLAREGSSLDVERRRGHPGELPLEGFLRPYGSRLRHGTCSAHRETQGGWCAA